MFRQTRKMLQTKSSNNSCGGQRISHVVSFHNLIICRFADIHRGGGARIVLISGDRDFAADIADYKRRMRLSVILLHTNNCPQSLMLAASEHYNFQELLSSVPVESRHADTPGRQTQVGD